ncbi:MAG TPA: TetR/AcrR family transcriptional regulator [Acidimicrobiales bacterium]|nr:TetR/AcrR family transcriptional regulator [Acidimicrobiales bacterium]
MPTHPEPEPILRRAPFADNPAVGARGQRTQQRILDAALKVFGDVGYHSCSIDRIAKVAGCSRVAVYQYFASKEDVFRHLAVQVEQEVADSTEALGPVTPDGAGWDALREWVGRHGEVYDRYEPVFQAFRAAAESDADVAGWSTAAGERTVGRVRERVQGSDLPARRIEPVVRVALDSLTRTADVAALLRSATPEAHPRDRVDDALTDVFHRALFGRDDGVNVHEPGPPPPAIQFGPPMLDLLQRDDDAPGLTAAGRRTLESLTTAGADVLVRRGFHGTRIDDVVAAAGVSHGAFYRYFENKEQLARVLAVRAMRRISTAFADIPAAVDGEGASAELRQWLRRYNAAQAQEAAVIRVWADAGLADPGVRRDSAAAQDWGRRRLARHLAARGFGDVETEAVILVAVLGSFGSRERSAASREAAALLIERGLFGR